MAGAAVVHRRTLGVGQFDPIGFLGWHCAYWTDGPLFRALGLTDTSRVATFPDETGNGRDLLQATAGNKPVYRTGAGLDLNGHGVVHDDDQQRYMQAAFATLAQPTTIVVCGRVGANTPSAMFDGADATFAARQTMQWSLGTGHFLIAAGSVLDDGNGDANPHFFACIFNGASSDLQIDGTSAVSGAAGALGLPGLTFLANAAAGGMGDSNAAFLGVYGGVISAPNLAILRAWSQSFYGTP